MAEDIGKRILIVGSSGAGKSTLAFELARRTGLPLRHLDKMVWLPKWVLRDRAEADKDLEAAYTEPAWIIDSAFRRHLGVAVDAADTVIFLDYPRWLCVARVIKRVLGSYGQVRPDMAEGCPEQVDLEFLTWIWAWKHTHRPAYVEALQGRPNVLVFRWPSELKEWLKTKSPA